MDSLKHPNETITQIFYVCGWLTTTNTDVVFEIPVGKKDGNIKAITAPSTYTIRQNGSYLKNAETFTGSLSYAQNEFSTRVSLTHSASIGGTNNDVVGVQINLSIEFS